MEEEIDDIVGDVLCTDSQKSVTTSNAYSPDFTDSSSDKNQSSDKNTYVIDWDDSDDSDKTFQIRHSPSIVNLKNDIEDLSQKKNIVVEPITTINRSACTSFHKCSIVSQEIYTQTSKTIFELAAKETDLNVTRESRTLHTQTSCLSVTENKIITHKIELTGVNENFVNHEFIKNYLEDGHNTATCNEIDCNQNMNTSQGDSSTKYPESETQNEITEDADSESTFSDRLIQFVDAESDENIHSKDHVNNEFTCEIESSKFDSDIEEDSLMINEYSNDKTDKLDSISDTSIPKSVDNDVEELYSKISESIDLIHPEKSVESNLRRFGTLTPLTEENMTKKDSIIDVTPCIKPNPLEEVKNQNFFTSKAHVRPSSSADKPIDKDTSKFKLPSIHKNKTCPNSPNLNFLFSVTNPSQGYGHDVVEERVRLLDRWDLCTKKLAGGESLLINGRNDGERTAKESLRLPPINMEGLVQNNTDKIFYFSTSRLDASSKCSTYDDSINIKDKIKELKVTERKPRLYSEKHGCSTSRAGSPTSTGSPGEAKLSEVAERGSEALCAEILRRLRSSSWTEAADTLEKLPHELDKFWGVLTETKIADLLRQVPTFQHS